MNLQIEVNGRLRAVVVARAGNRFRVTLDGRDWVVDAALVDVSTFSLICEGQGFRSHEVGIEGTGTPGGLAVHTAGGVASVRILTGAARSGRPGGPAHATGIQQVLAPMPGKVVKVLVAPGEQVKARQGLIVVEAMKMENELRSPKDGRVREVAVAAGTSVEAGRLLIVVE